MSENKKIVKFKSVPFKKISAENKQSALESITKSMSGNELNVHFHSAELVNTPLHRIVADVYMSGTSKTDIANEFSRRYFLSGSDLETIIYVVRSCEVVNDSDEESAR